MIQFSQRHGKISLPQQKQGNYPVIPIYGDRDVATAVEDRCKKIGTIAIPSITITL